jgi:hypothetical protein
MLIRRTLSALATRRIGRALTSLAALGAIAVCASAAGGAVGASAGPPGGRSSPEAAHVASLAISHAPANVVQRQPAPGSCHARGRGDFTLPDRRCTPGAIDPAVRQSNIAVTICRSGYTRTVRPPESVTETEKRASLASYGDAGPLHAYEYDHLVPLELGGARNDPRNLWPEPGSTPNPKDALENRLRAMVCAGQLSLAGAQREIALDWVGAYRRVIE